MVQLANQSDRLTAPSTGEDHGTPTPSPLPATSIAEQFAEMVANDPEYQEWQQAERMASLFGHPR